jgi:LacI family transcriptional regulator
MVKPRPTQQDVARLAGVSRAVVSYVINNQTSGKIRISDDARRRVLQAVKELGYQPNVTARSLRTNRTQLLAVMVPDLTNPFYPLLIRGAQAAAEREDYQILVYDTNDTAAREQIFVEIMLRRRVDGVILVAFHLETSDVERMLRAGVQVAAVGGRPRPEGVDIVAPRERLAVHEVMRHLISRGHRRIAHLAGAADTPPGRVRLQGYREALSEAGIPYDESLVLQGTFGRDGVAELVSSCFVPSADAACPTALFAANDVMAIEAMRTLARLGRRIPGDVAVCGFDNIPEAEFVVPSLTTVDQDAQMLGQRAAEFLLERLADRAPAEARHVNTPYRLVVREST